MVKTSTSRAEDPALIPNVIVDLFPSHTSDLKTGAPVASLPGAWHYRTSAGTGRPGVSVL